MIFYPCHMFFPLQTLYVSIKVNLLQVQVRNRVENKMSIHGPFTATNCGHPEETVIIMVRRAR